MEVERHEALIPVEGAVLAADFMLPDWEGPFPVAISMYPYRKDDIIGSLFLAPRIRLAQAGIATLLVDMRGHGASSGEPAVSFDLAGIEGQDTADVVEWAAAQPWSDGNVGIWGVSYGGMTGLAAAVRHPAHLRAIFAVYPCADTYRDWIAPGGDCPMAFGNYLWSSFMLGRDLCSPSRQDADGRWRRVWQERLDRLKAKPGHAFEWLEHRGDSDYWNGRALDVSRITVPTFMVESWHDFFLDGTVRTFSELTCEKRLVLGPWLHICPDLVDREPYDWVREMVAWFIRHLRQGAGPDERTVFEAAGETSGGEASSSTLLFVHGAQVWRRHESWPPPETQSVVMYFHEGGGLDGEPSTEAREVHYRPTAITGLEAGMFDPLGTGFGYPGDQHADDRASLQFETAALEEPLELAGRPEATLSLRRVETPDLRLTVKFCDVAEDGHSELLTTGWLRVSEQLRGTARATVTVHGGPIAAVIARGHRLRVAVSSIDFPRAWPTPGPAGFALNLGETNDSRVVLPVLPDIAVSAGVAAEVPRPVTGPRPDWVNSSAVRYRLTREEPNGVVEAVLLNEAELAPPSGALMTLEEQFTARVAATDPTSARVAANVTIMLNLVDGTHVQVNVETEFAETSARASGSVRLDGEKIFEQHWAFPEGGEKVTADIRPDQNHFE